jgi:hypothetical protein
MCLEIVLLGEEKLTEDQMESLHLVFSALGD